MSAVTETERGGELVCILEFSARPRDAGRNPIPGERRVFHVGERVRLLDSFDRRTPEDNPIGPMAVFEPWEADGNLYEATASYFLTTDCWEGLRDYFAQSLLVTIEHDPGADHAEPSAYRLVQVESPSR